MASNVGAKRKYKIASAGGEINPITHQSNPKAAKTKANHEDVKEYEDILRRLLETFEKNANEDIAPGMKAYMRDQFDYYGLQKPRRAELSKSLLNELCSLSLEPDDVANVVKFLWMQTKRECAYVAIDYINKLPKSASFWSVDNSSSALSLIEYMIITSSWWDTVDIIASTFIGHLFELFPTLVGSSIERWDGSSNIWLQRTSIIYQLKYKSKTNEEILFNQCKKYMHSEEFFLRKSIGWALREYAKTKPTAVQSFLKKNGSLMSALSVREASKYL